MSLIHFPSADGPAFDFYAHAPQYLDNHQAVQLARGIITQARHDASPGAGEGTIQSMTLQRLTDAGFSILLGAEIDALEHLQPLLDDGYRAPSLRMRLAAGVTLTDLEWDAARVATQMTECSPTNEAPG